MLTYYVYSSCLCFYIFVAEDFMQKYLKAKHDLGSVELKLLNILVFGPPGVGKSTLLSVLLCQNIQLLRESTGLLDRKLVQLKVAVQRDVAKCTSQWKVVNIDEEILRLRHTIQAKLENCTLENSNDLCSDLKPDMKIDEKFQTSVDSMIYEDQSSSITQQYTTSNTLIACYDSGGQPEFFDVMPAFISSTTGNVMVFDMSKDLDSNVDPDFFKNGQRWASSNRKTHYTGAQLLKTALANIQSYATDYPLCSAKSSHCGNSRLLVVGTHLDLCGDTEEEVHERLCQMEEKICADLLHDYSAPSIIKRCGERCTKTIFPIANKCDYKDCDEVIRDRKEVAQEIRTAIESMSENEKASKEIPISWLLFQYEIKLYSFPCISRSDCDEIAEKCYINKGDVDDVLRYFHELGIFLYYQDKDKRLSHVVFSDPQWLFAQLNKLIELKYNPSYDEKRSIKKGIFMKQFLTEIYGKEFNTELLHYEDIINLFVHLNIMARLSDATEQYFMPALLDPFSNDIPINTTFGNKIFSTLYVKFKDGFFPRGVFCCLIALCVKKNKSWKLQSNAAYKDLVVFQIENNEEFLILSDKIHYISLEIHCKEELKQNKHQVLSCVLYENLKEVCNTIHLDGEFKFGFLCKGKICEKFAHVQIQYPYYPENLLCSVCEYNPRMTYDQLIWFIPPKVLDVLTKVGMYTCIATIQPKSILNSCALNLLVSMLYA